MTRVQDSAWALAMLALAGHSIVAAEELPCEETPTQACHATVARKLIESRKAHEAISLLKKALAASPRSRELTLLLIQAYMTDNNDLWALRTAAEWREQHPDDCETASWVAWIFVKQGSLDEARGELSSSTCWQSPPLRTRRFLILAFVERYAGDDLAARAHLEAARSSKRAFAEDRAAIASVTGRDPGFVPPLAGRLDMALGYATNARAGSPVDPAARGDARDTAVARLRVAAPVNRLMHPMLEFDIRSLAYSASAGRDLSYLLLGGRPGIALGWLPRVLLAYHNESLLLAGGDRYKSGPLWFYYRPFPLKGHAGSTEGGLAALSAAEQRAFWPFWLHVYANYAAFDPRLLPEWAERLGMNRTAFEQAYSAAKTREALVAAKQEGISNRVTRLRRSSLMDANMSMT